MTKSYSINSWHYRLATHYGDFDKGARKGNICDYILQVVKGIIIVFCITIGLSLVGVILGAPLWWIVVGAMNDYWISLNDDSMILVVIGFIIYACFLFFLCVFMFHDWKQRHPNINIPNLTVLTDNFIVDAIQSISKKMCRPIVFKELMDELPHIRHDYGIFFGDNAKFSSVCTSIPPYTELDPEVMNAAKYIYDYTAEVVIKNELEGEELETAKRSLEWNTMFIQYNQFQKIDLNLPLYDQFPFPEYDY